MKVLITGSHFTPAQAVIEVFKSTYPDVEMVYVGRKYSIEGDKTSSVESQQIPNLGVKFIPITTGRMQVAFSRYTIPSLLKIPIGFIHAFWILLQEKPNVVLSFGGYVSVPIVVVSWLLSIPIIIHEQTLITGLSNRICSLFASKIAVSFNKKYSFNKAKLIVSGNPIREEVIHPKSKISNDLVTYFKNAKKDKLPVILITGGSQGSHIINQVIEKVLDHLVNITYVIHQTGDSNFGDFDRLKDKKANFDLSDRYFVEKWLTASQMGHILKQVDLVISRAGVNTLLELAYFGIPSLVIPIPYLYKDEQMVNAEFFRNLGLVKILPQQHLNEKNLLFNIQQILNGLNNFKKQAQRAKMVIIPDAAQTVAIETLFLSLPKQ